MKRRTTIEIDDELLNRARKALGMETTRGTVEQALRLAADQVEEAHKAVAEGQRAFLRRLGEWTDLEILKSDEMWR